MDCKNLSTNETRKAPTSSKPAKMYGCSLMNQICNIRYKVKFYVQSIQKSFKTKYDVYPYKDENQTDDHGW